MHAMWRKERARVRLLETLIKKYATHVGACEGVSFLEERYSSPLGGTHEDAFTAEEWAEIRRIAGETE